MDSSTLSTGLELPDVERGQKWARVYAGIQNEKGLQTARKSGDKVQKTEQGHLLRSQTLSMGGLSPRDYFRPWEVVFRWAMAAAMGLWVRARPCRKGPPGLTGERSRRPGPEGVGRGLFHFKVKICRLWETIFKKVYNLHMPLNGGSS